MRSSRVSHSWQAVYAILLLIAAGCSSPGKVAEVVKERDNLRYQIERVERDVAERDATIDGLKAQVQTLQKLDPNRPVDLYAPTRVEIASRSGGADYDGKPGDDGITIYLRPHDADGDAVKTPGKITLELLDTSEPGTPRSIAVCKYEDPKELRKIWHARFLTQHFSLKCPFPEGVKLPASRHLLASVTFTDLLSGAVLKAEQDVTFIRRSD